MLYASLGALVFSLVRFDMYRHLNSIVMNYYSVKVDIR